MRLFRYAAVAAIAAPLAAQVPARPSLHSVIGVVFDSTQLSPLAGAVVQAVLVAAGTASPRTFTTLADADGRFRFDTLPAGRFAIGFQHNTLDAFGLDSPLTGFEWKGDSSLTVDLTLSSSPPTRVQLCGATNDISYPAVLQGYATEFQSGIIPPGTKIVVQWFELGLNKGRISSIPHEVVAKVSETGTYLACNLPANAPLAVAVFSPGHHAVDTEVTIPVNRVVVRRDFTLTDASRTTGTASINARVSTSDGTPIPNGLVALRALGINIAIVDGAFAFVNLPGGTWALEVRAIGYDPATLTVSVADAANTSVNVTLIKRAQTLDAVNIVGKSGRDMRVLEEIQQRMIAHQGTYFGPGNAALASAQSPADVIRSASGFTYVGRTAVLARPYGPAGNRCESAQRTTQVIASDDKNTKMIAIYLDGARQPGGLESVTSMAPMKSILAIETYADIQSAPQVWRTNDACAVIAVWTRPQY